MGLALLVGLYYGVAQFGYAFKFAGPVAAVVWLPVGVGIAFLYLFGLQFWPAVVIGDLLSNNYGALPLGSALGQTCGNLLEVLVAAALLQRIARRGPPLATVPGVARTFAALAAGTAISATVGSLSLRLGHVITTGAVPSVWRTWWLGDWCGALLVVPLVIAWVRPLHHNLWRRRWLEASIGFAAVVGSSALALYSSRPLTYIVFPALIWSALRLRQRGATLATAVAAWFAVGATTHYVGPFYSDSLGRSVLQTQLFIAVASLSTLCLAAVETQRARFAASLLASRARLVETADAERRRVQRNIHDGAQQRATAAMIRLGMAAEKVRDEPAAAQAALEQAQHDVELVIVDLRELAHGRHPRVLTERGLPAAIRSIAESSPIPIQVTELPMVPLPEKAETTAYYVIAEAVTNAQRYSHASALELRASVSHQALRVQVVDDGVGGAAEMAGSGLQGLRDRVEAVGGTFELDTILGHGTRVAAEIPLRSVAR
jgi:signal transduction histidine kinase